MRKAIAGAVGLLAAFTLTGTADAATVTYYRWALQGDPLYHLNNPARGEVRVDTWVGERTDLQTIEQVQAVGRVVKIRNATRVQVDVVRLESLSGRVLARNATPVNSGTSNLALQSTAWTDTGFNDQCATPEPLRTRVALSIRWADGTLSKGVTVVGGWSEEEFCTTVAPPTTPPPATTPPPPATTPPPTTEPPVETTTPPPPPPGETTPPSETP